MMSNQTNLFLKDYDCITTLRNLSHVVFQLEHDLHALVMRIFRTVHYIGVMLFINLNINIFFRVIICMKIDDVAVVYNQIT